MTPWARRRNLERVRDRLRGKTACLHKDRANWRCLDCGQNFWLKRRLELLREYDEGMGLSCR
jgi:hypothetical protein